MPKQIREVYGSVLAELGETNENIVVLDADLSGSTKSAIFGKAHPERFFNMGIAEQNMVATAAGMTACGKIPFVNTFTVFLTSLGLLSARDQICYANLNVKFGGAYCGMSDALDGASHHATEDIAFMRALPNMKVIAPADAAAARWATKYAVENYGPMYIRIPRTNVCDIFDENEDFDFCKARVIQEGCDVTVITNGETLAEVIQAAQILEKDGYSIQIIHVPVVKPLDDATIIEQAKLTKFVITVENHSIIGGLGSAVCELLSYYYPMPVIRIGVNDTFGQSGKWDELLDYYGLSADKLSKNIKKQIDRYRLVK